MNILFRSHCDDILRDYVYSSGKREAERRELYAEMEERMRIDRRFLRKRMLSLERERLVSENRMETLSCELERLHLRLGGLESRLQTIEEDLKMQTKCGIVGNVFKETQTEQLSDEDSKSTYVQLRSDEWTRI